MEVEATRKCYRNLHAVSNNLVDTRSCADNIPSFFSDTLEPIEDLLASVAVVSISILSVFSASFASSTCSGLTSLVFSSPFSLSVSFTPSQVGPYSPLRFTPLLSPSGKTPLRKVNIRPQKMVVVPIFERRRRRSLSVRKSIRAFPFWGTIPSVSLAARASIHEKM